MLKSQKNQGFAVTVFNLQLILPSYGNLLQSSFSISVYNLETKIGKFLCCFVVVVLNMDFHSLKKKKVHILLLFFLILFQFTLHYFLTNFLHFSLHLFLPPIYFYSFMRHLYSLRKRVIPQMSYLIEIFDHGKTVLNSSH